MHAFEIVIDADLAEAEAMVRRTLGEQGFGVLTEIDVAATLRAKLGVERKGLKILGACNPAFAHRALGIEPTVALMLPCNVVLEDLGETRTSVSVVDPRELLGGFKGSRRQELEELGDQAAVLLERAIGALGTQAGGPVTFDPTSPPVPDRESHRR